MHPILRYMARHGFESQQKFATLVGLSRQHVSNIVLGRHQMGRKSAVKIEKITKGELTVQELLTWQPRRRKRRTEQTPGCAEERTAARAR